MALGHHRSDLLWHAAHQDARLRLDDGHLGAAPDRARREFQPDEAAADDGDALAGLKMPADGKRIVEAAQGEAARPGLCRQRKLPGQRARRQQQPVIGKGRAVGKRHVFCGPVDGNSAFAGETVDAVLGESVREADPLRLRRLGVVQRFLRQRRPFVGQVRLVADQRDAACVAQFTQGEGCARAAFAGSDDDHARHENRTQSLVEGRSGVDLSRFITAISVIRSVPIMDDVVAVILQLTRRLGGTELWLPKGQHRRPGVQKFRLDSLIRKWNKYSIRKANGIFVLFSVSRRRAEEKPGVSKVAGPGTEVWTGVPMRT